MLFPGRYWSAYWRLIKAAAGLAALGVLAWGALRSLGMYEGYAELVLAIVIFAPVGLVFFLHGLGLFYAVLLRFKAAMRSRRELCPAGVVGSVALVGAAFILSGLVFVVLSLNAIVAIAAR